MTIENLENLMITGMIEGRGKQRIKMLKGLITKWLNVEQVIDALKAIMVRDEWKVMIAFAKEQLIE